jgi:ankyrin repeat protein
MDFDINTVDNTVGSLLHYAVILSNFDSNGFQKCISSDNYLNTIEVLLENGVEVNLINKLGETPLHLCRNCLIVDLLLAHGAQMNVKEVTGKTPLFTYFCRANYDMCLELLKHGSDLEIIDRFGNSLFYAVIHSNAPIRFIKLLLDAGVCLNNERWFIEKLFPLRLKKKYPKVISFLEWRSRNPLSLKEQCRKNIRTYLNRVNRNTSVLNRVQNLPVPLCLQDYILFNLK